jgi:hypothetical protein
VVTAARHRTLFDAGKRASWLVLRSCLPRSDIRSYRLLVDSDPLRYATAFVDKRVRSAVTAASFAKINRSRRSTIRALH